MLSLLLLTYFIFLSLKDCQESQECLNFNCLPKACKVPKVENGKITGLSPLSNFAADTKSLNSSILILESVFKIRPAERYPVGYKVNLMKCTGGVIFTNVLWAAFKWTDTKHTKRHWWLDCLFFCKFGICSKKSCA